MKKVILLWMLGAAALAFVACSGKKGQGYGTQLLDRSWTVQSADSLTAGGAEISRTDFTPDHWYAATVPSTVLHCLVSNGVYRDIYRDDNLKKIPVESFHAPWWYRTTFALQKVTPGVLLKFDGINYRANVWLNGRLVADTTTVVNSFRTFTLDITPFVVQGENVLAVEVVPPRPGDFAIGFVDWNPQAPDRDMGIFRPVYLEQNGGVEVSEPFIVTSLSGDHTRATLTASVMVTNRLKQKISGKAILSFGGKEMSVPVELAAGKSGKVIFDPGDFEELTVEHPDLWWPHTVGTPHLYHASFSFKHSGKVSDKKDVTFGIRTVSSQLTPEGHRLFLVNGRKIQIHGAGWTDRMLLDDTPVSLRKQLAYVKDIGLNAIRLEGFWGNSQTLYDLCDSLGILVMTGWSCHWEWEHYVGKPVDEQYGGILTGAEMALMSEAWKDQIVWLRNHPAIFAWFGASDKVPKPELEKRYFNILKEFDSTRVYLASAGSHTTLAGPTGVKMEGPYAYVPPVYWFSDTLKGGAYGFATEIGPGAQVPPAESIHRMLSEQHWWPIDSMWYFHCGRGKFGTLDRYMTALQARYGKVAGFDDFEKKAQLLNYELMRPMFEAYSARRFKATGLILWMLNSAWPEMYWQLYDFYLMPNAAYYGAKKALQPYHVVYDYYRKKLYAVNDRMEDKKGCNLRIRVYDVHSAVRFDEKVPVDLRANSSAEVFSLDKVDVPGVHFLDTRLYDAEGTEIDNNFYWISPKRDILDYNDPDTPSWVTTASKQYADFTEINSMPAAEVASSVTSEKKDGVTRFQVTLENKSQHIAFFIHASLRDPQTHATILPVLWSDNYVSLLPGETRVLQAEINNEALEGRTPEVKVEGYNVSKK